MKPFQTRSRSVLTLTAALALACSEPVSSPVDLSSQSANAKIDANAYMIVDIGTYGTGSGAIALAMDKHGTLFGRFGLPAGGQRSFRWTDKDGFEDLGDFDGNAFQVFAANDHFMLNGSTFTTGTPVMQRAVGWLPHSGFFYLDAGYAGNSGVSNNRGQIPGTRFGSGTSEGWVWSADTGAEIIPLTIPGRTILGFAAGAINNDGAVTGTVASTQTGGPPNTRTNRAYVWHPENGVTVIPPLGPPAAGPFGPANVGVTYISDEGLVIGASEMQLATTPGARPSPLASTPGTIPVHAWKWSPSLGLVDLGTLGGNHSVPWNADKDGNVYGWASDATGRKHAVKWVASGGIIDLGSLGGDALTGALNKHGVVAGWAIAPDGKAHVVRFDPAK